VTTRREAFELGLPPQEASPGLFHELDHKRVVEETIDEVAETLKEKTKGYRNG